MDLLLTTARPPIPEPKPKISFTLGPDLSPHPDTDLLSCPRQAGVEFGAVRATLTGAIWQMFGTAFALWIPCLPIFFLMRNALNSKAGNKCAPVHPWLPIWPLLAAKACVPASCSSSVTARLMLCCGGRLGMVQCRAADAKPYRPEPGIAMLRHLSAWWRAVIPWPSRLTLWPLL